MPKYPVFISPEGKEYECLFHAITPRIFWEHYGFEKVNDDVYYGYVMGYEDEWGTFSVSELKGVNALITTKPEILDEVLPPKGWTKKGQ